jgi:RNA polymerase sigma-70 factor (family 1)
LLFRSYLRVCCYPLVLYCCYTWKSFEPLSERFEAFVVRIDVILHIFSLFSTSLHGITIQTLLFPHPPYEEKELLKLIADGDHSAFQHLFHSHYTQLAFFARTIVGDLPTAEDLVQDAFVRLWEKRQTIRDQGNLRSFLYTIVRNVCLDFLRRLNNRTAKQEEFAYLIEHDSAFLEVAVLQEELLRLVMSEVEMLPEKYNRVIRMIFIEGLSYEEISQQLDLSEAAVRKQKERALKLLNNAVLNRTGLPLLLISAQLFFLADLVTKR